MGDWECGKWAGEESVENVENGTECRFLDIFTPQVNVFQDRLERVQRYAEHPMPYIYKQVCMTHLTIPPKLRTLMNQAMNHLRIFPGCSVCCHILLYAGSCGGAGADLRRGGERGVAKLWISHISAPQVHLYSWVAFRCRDYQVKVLKESNRMRYNDSKEPVWRGWGGCEHLSVPGLQHLGGQLCHSGPG